MRAAVVKKYGDPSVLSVREVPRPDFNDDELLIRNYASTVDPLDARIRAFDFAFPRSVIMRLMLGISGPRQAILGRSFAGEVVAVGRRVRDFRVGDQVFGSRTGLNFGAHADFIKVSAKAPLALMPEGASYAEAVALLSGGGSALHSLEQASYKTAKNNLILGGNELAGAPLDIPVKTKAHVKKLRELFERGELRPLIDRTYKLRDIAAAHARVDKRWGRGSVVIMLEE